MVLTCGFCIWAVTWQNQQNECAPSKDSDQPGHLPSLIRVFAVRLKKPRVLSYPLSAQWRLWSLTGQMPRLIWVFAGRSRILLVLSCRGSYISYMSIVHRLRSSMFVHYNQDFIFHLSLCMTKPTKWHMHTAKTLSSLIRAFTVCSMGS